MPAPAAGDLTSLIPYPIPAAHYDGEIHAVACEIGHDFTVKRAAYLADGFWVALDEAAPADAAGLLVVKTPPGEVPPPRRAASRTAAARRAA